MSTVPRDGGSSPVCPSAGPVRYAFYVGRGISSPNGWWLGLFLGYDMMTTSDKKFAADSGVAHPVHNMIRDRAAFV